MKFFRMNSGMGMAVIVLGALLIVWVLPVDALEIKVRDQVTVSGSTVILRDIASFVPETDPRVDALARIDVASAPSPGNSVNLNRSFLNYKIGAVISGKEDIQLEVPAIVSIRRTASVISRTQMESIFRNHVLSRIPLPPEKIVFEKVDVPESVALPEGKVHWEIWERGSDRYLGNVLLTIHFHVDGKQIRNVPVSGKISVRQEVLKAARKINPGQVLSREDVQLVMEQSGHVLKEGFTSPEDAVGKRAVRSIQAGQAITSQLVEDPPIVKKGHRVLILAEKDMIRASTQGKVMEDGRMGEEVRVVNLNSGKEVFATVKGPGRVEVVF